MAWTMIVQSLICQCQQLSSVQKSDMAFQSEKQFMLISCSPLTAWVGFMSSLLGDCIPQSRRSLKSQSNPPDSSQAANLNAGSYLQGLNIVGEVGTHRIPIWVHGNQINADGSKPINLLVNIKICGKQLFILTILVWF